MRGVRLVLANAGDVDAGSTRRTAKLLNAKVTVLKRVEARRNHAGENHCKYFVNAAGRWSNCRDNDQVDLPIIWLAPKSLSPIRWVVSCDAPMLI